MLHYNKNWREEVGGQKKISFLYLSSAPKQKQNAKQRQISHQAGAWSLSCHGS